MLENDCIGFPDEKSYEEYQNTVQNYYITKEIIARNDTNIQAE